MVGRKLMPSVAMAAALEIEGPQVLMTWAQRERKVRVSTSSACEMTVFECWIMNWRGWFACDAESGQLPCKVTVRAEANP